MKSLRFSQFAAGVQSMNHARRLKSQHRLIQSCPRLPPSRLCPTFYPTLSRRHVSNVSTSVLEPDNELTEGERKVFEKLNSELQPIKLSVQDISGGCGSMYGVDIVSPKFSGLTVIKQHKLVNAILADDIKQWHGMQLKTRAP